MKKWADAEDSVDLIHYEIFRLFSVFGVVKLQAPRSVNHVYGTEFDNKIITQYCIYF